MDFVWKPSFGIAVVLTFIVLLFLVYVAATQLLKWADKVYEAPLFTIIYSHVVMCG